MNKYIKIELNYPTRKEKYLVTYFSYLNNKIVLGLDDGTEETIKFNTEYSIYVNGKLRYSSTKTETKTQKN